MTNRSLRKSWRSWPIIRHLRGIQFRRMRPLHGGRLDRGTVIVRYYWARFLEQYRADIRGRGLEIGETTTLRTYGGHAITQAEALDLAPHTNEVTVVADLSRADHLAANQYDCFIIQFTMTVIYDVEAALYHAIRVLRPGGTLLINFACVDYYLYRGLDMGTGAPLYMYWWYTPLQVEDLLQRTGLTPHDYSLTIYGNLFTRMAFQLNLPAEDLTRYELDHADPGHPLLICARIVKPITWSAPRPPYRDPRSTPADPPAHLDPQTGHYGDEYV
ncbi:MAG TPA: methyltransferase domain-containing protein [Roseiflexaceae bacterium]|nr:methyltransferase domain-containing protein [Roseiflexaceae bacterium]HMP40447.1 methyltransferase domain-containing protein [Roseiflexaceae bacterium]